jgi:hypothetical protein
LLDNSLLPDSEIKNLLDKEYCKQTFGLSFPLLQSDPAKIIFTGHNRYWTLVKFGKHHEYWVCSQWWKSKEDEYQEKLTAWIRKIKRLHEK